MDKVICVIPAYNESRKIGSVLENIPDYVFKTVVVDDGSTDNTVEIVRQHDVILIQNQRNMGLGAGYKKGYKKALELGADIIVVLHSDGQHDPAETARVIEPIKHGKADYVLGSRFMKGSAKIGKQPMVRKIGNKLIIYLWTLASGQKLTDIITGYHAISRAALEKLDFETWSDGFRIETDALIEIFLKNYRVVDVPVSCIYADEISYINPFHEGWDYSLAAIVLLKKKILKRLFRRC